jgi:nucleoside-diphosphate-sugar epimerase
MVENALRSLLLLGCGYTGLEVARQARALGLSVAATTRSEARRAELEKAGATALVHAQPALETLAAHVDGSTGLIVSFPPDGQTDARLVPLAARAFASAYVSSTGVYGDTRGRIDDSTPSSPDSPRNALRVAAETLWRAQGAAVLRVGAIYGPFRGQHERVRSGSARIAGDGSHFVCRLHVEDLAAALLRTLSLRLRGESYVVADDQPAPQGEVVRWLAARLGVPVPASVPLDGAPETLRHDRQVDAWRFKRDTGMAWRYPTYREGFEACLRAEGARSPSV